MESEAGAVVARPSRTGKRPARTGPNGRTVPIDPIGQTAPTDRRLPINRVRTGLSALIDPTGRRPRISPGLTVRTGPIAPIDLTGRRRLICRVPTGLIGRGLIDLIAQNGRAIRTTSETIGGIVAMTAVTLCGFPTRSKPLPGDFPGTEHIHFDDTRARASRQTANFGPREHGLEITLEHHAAA